MRYNTWKIAESGAGLPLIDAIYAARGLTGADQPGPPPWHDPFLLPDMDKAAACVENAINSGQKIAVYGDYDVDGVTACALLTDYLRWRAGEDRCVYYVPRRDDQGYGLHAAALEALRDAGVTLVITVDVGVTAFEAAQAAADLGLDLVITDHHECREGCPPPRAAAVVDPKRPDSRYPFGGLAGVGVAFKLVCALEWADARRVDELLERYSDLVALGTVADVMPMLDENRVFTRRGLALLDKRPGIRGMMKRAGAGRPPFTAQMISFSLAPLLNAAGRMGDASPAVELLLTKEKRRAEQLAGRLFGMNHDRRALEAGIYAQAAAQWEAVADNASRPALVMAGRGWHPGVTGIVCARLMEKYRKPVFLITLNENTAKGSARAQPGGPSLTEILAACEHTLLTFGGHAAAAGFTVDPAKLDAFRDAVFEALDRMPPPQTGADANALVIDAAARPEELTMANAEAVRLLGPFGSCNPEPVLLLENAVIAQVTPLKEGKHIRLTLEAGEFQFNAIGFGFSDFPYRAGDRIDAAFTLSVNSFRSERSVQLELRDVRPDAETARRYATEAALYENFRNNEQYDAGQITRLASLTREDLTSVWRYLDRTADTLCQVNVPENTLIGGVSALNPRMGMARLLAALDVFTELELLTYRRVSGVFSISLRAGHTKADLANSKLLKRLTAV